MPKKQRVIGGDAERSGVASEHPHPVFRMDADRPAIEHRKKRSVPVHNREFPARASCDDHRRVAIEEDPVRRAQFAVHDIPSDFVTIGTPS